MELTNICNKIRNSKILMTTLVLTSYGGFSRSREKTLFNQNIPYKKLQLRRVLFLILRKVKIISKSGSKCNFERLHLYM